MVSKAIGIMLFVLTIALVAITSSSSAELTTINDPVDLLTTKTTVEPNLYKQSNIDKIKYSFDVNGELSGLNQTDVLDMVNVALDISGFNTLTAYSASITENGQLDIIGEKITNKMVKSLSNQLGLQITAENVKGYGEVQSVGAMFNDTSPFNGGTRIVSIDSGGYFPCTSAYAYKDNAVSGDGPAALISAGHCANFGVTSTWTANSSDNLYVQISGSSKVDSLDTAGNSRKMTNGGYNGDITRFDVLKGKSVSAYRYKNATDYVKVVGFESGRNPSLRGTSLCWTGSKTGGTRCDFVVSRVNIIDRVGDHIYQPMTEAIGPKDNCPVVGDSGGPVFRQDNGKIVGVLSSKLKGINNCVIIFTPHGEVREAFPGANLINGETAKG